MAPAAARHVAEEVVPQFPQQTGAAQQRHGGAHLLLATTHDKTGQLVGGGQTRAQVGGWRAANLGGLVVVQVPELDVAVAGGHEVGAVVREGDGRHLAGHLVGGDHHILLFHTNTQHTEKSKASH